MAFKIEDGAIWNGATMTATPLDPANTGYQAILDSINTDGADAWDDTVATYDDIPEDLRTAAESKKFNQQLADYKVAKARLEQYEVATGRAEETETVVVGQEWDEDAQDFVDVTETYVSKRAIDPVEATVEQTTYDENGENAVTTNIEKPTNHNRQSRTCGCASCR